MKSIQNIKLKDSILLMIEIMEVILKVVEMINRLK